MDPESSTTSWIIPVVIGFFAIYVLKRLIPRPKVDIKEKFVLITGCDTGFGRETAIRLDKMGVRVLATCLTKDGEQSLRSATSDKLTTFRMDVTNSQQIKSVYEEVKRQIPRDSGRLSCNFYGAYAATKYGVEAFSDALRREMYPWGIKVSIMEPGGFQTQISDPRKAEKQMRQGWDDLSEELKREYGKDYLEKGISYFTSYSTSARTYQVVDAVVDGLTSQSPRDRYLVGYDARFFFGPIICLPAVVADFIFRCFVFRLPAPLGSK